MEQLSIGSFWNCLKWSLFGGFFVYLQIWNGVFSHCKYFLYSVITICCLSIRIMLLCIEPLILVMLCKFTYTYYVIYQVCEIVACSAIS